eukprot:maker-scaffold177_size283923-snap-gene-1.29 protein:Tk02070 transcript:maker-scaffold177_size283923-snap-gene-1.29-mRNA-1 annotation:"PREDICTED: uncharacterized protein C14orf119 homolog"
MAESDDWIELHVETLDEFDREVKELAECLEPTWEPQPIGPPPAVANLDELDVPVRPWNDSKAKRKLGLRPLSTKTLESAESKIRDLKAMLEQFLRVPQRFIYNMNPGKARTELACAQSWFSNWTSQQRIHFADRFKIKLLKGLTLESLMDDIDCMSLSSLEGPPVFDCQLRIVDGWIRKWNEEERNNFRQIIGSMDPQISN